MADTCTCGQSTYKDGEWTCSNIGLGEEGFCHDCGDKLLCGGGTESRAVLQTPAPRILYLRAIPGPRPPLRCILTIGKDGPEVEAIHLIAVRDDNHVTIECPQPVVKAWSLEREPEHLTVEFEFPYASSAYPLSEFAQYVPSQSEGGT